MSVDSSGWVLSGTAPDTLYTVSYPVVVTVSSDTYQDVQRWNIIVYPDSSELEITSSPTTSVSSGGVYTYIPLTNIKGVVCTNGLTSRWLSI